MTAVTEFGCTAASNTRPIHALPNISRMFTGCQEVCFPETLCVAEAPESTSYQWFMDGNPISGATMSTLEINDIGEYQVVLENIFGCTIMSDILSITPETKEQTLSGIVYVDDNGNGIHDPGEAFMENVPVNIFSGSTVYQVTSTDANGYYEFDPLENSNAMVVIDVSSLGFDASQSTLFYNFELKACLEDLVQDFPLNISCNNSTFSLTLQTCPGEQIEYENEFYDAGQTAQVITTDMNGCQSTIDLSVIEYDLEPYQLSTDNTCANANEGVLYINANPSAGLEFSLDDGATYTSDLSIPNLNPGSYNLTVLDINGCTSVEPFEILELAEPDFNYSTIETCQDDASGTIIISNNSNSNLEFAVDDPGSMTQLTSIGNLGGGPHTLYIIDESGCEYTYQFDIDVFDIPVIDVIPQETCPDIDSGSIQIDNPASANVEFAINDLSLTSSNTSFQDLPAGNHTLFIIDENGCTSTVDFTIDIYDMPLLNLVASPSCFGENNGSINIADPGMDLEFSVDGSNFSDDLNINNLSSGNQTLYVETEEGCEFEVDFTITELNEFSFDYTPEVACIGLDNGSIELHGAMNLNYSLDGSPYQIENTFTDLAPGNYLVTAQDENGCTSELEIVIEEHQEIEITFNEPEIDCATDEVELNSSSDDPSQLSFQWSTGETSENIIVNQSGLYQVLIDDGCTTRAKEWDIRFEADLAIGNPAFVPNIFNPNALDGNQECRPYINQDIELLEYRFSIYDRWGNRMFDSNDHSEYWDGEFNSIAVDPGVFVWRIELEYIKCFEPIEYTKYGDITLFK